MMTYLLGPFLALLPATWRANLSWAESIRWRRAAFLSGALEVCASLGALVVWYSYSVTHHTRLQLDILLRAHPNIQLNAPRLGLLGFILVALNPVTLVLVWFYFEGVVRAFGAAFTGEILGTLPLWIIDRSYGVLRRRQHNRRLPPLVPDEVAWHNDALHEVLRIMSCRPKTTWENHPAIHIKGEFFRVEKSIQVLGGRPYVYQLRRLQPGEIIRAPLNYDPQAVLSEPQQEKNILVSIYRSLRNR
jgi:hypothetical protein